MAGRGGWALGALLGIALGGARADDAQLVLLPVYSRPAAELVESLRPLLGPGGSLAAHGQHLVVRASAAEIETLRGMLEQLDQAPRQLLVEVRRAGADTWAPAGTRVIQTHDAGVQRVRALDGSPALIRVGRSLPAQPVIERWPGGAAVGPVGAERELETGFYVVPRTHGDSVTLELYQRDDRLEGTPGSGRVDTRQAASRVRGRLGEWLEVGGAERQASGSGGRRWTTRTDEDWRLWVRVTEVAD